MSNPNSRKSTPKQPSKPLFQSSIFSFIQKSNPSSSDNPTNNRQMIESGDLMLHKSESSGHSEHFNATLIHKLKSNQDEDTSSSLATSNDRATKANKVMESSDIEWQPSSSSPQSVTINTVVPKTLSHSFNPKESPLSNANAQKGKPNPVRSKLLASVEVIGTVSPSDKGTIKNEFSKSDIKTKIQTNKEKYSFLTNPLDEHQRDSSHPEYDPRTLYIPVNIYYNMTDFERQYWDIKRKNFDTIVFFQKGIFYELMEADADIAQAELGLASSFRAGMRMVGFLKTEGEKHAQKLLRRGHKVCFVSQNETPIDRRLSSGTINESSDNIDDRLEDEEDEPRTPKSKNPKKRKSISSLPGETGSGHIDDINSPSSGKMLKRVVERIVTPGTAIEENYLTSTLSSFLFSICESKIQDIPGNDQSASIEFGICLLDASTSQWIIGKFQEKNLDFLMNLRTLLFQTRPKELLHEKGNISKKVLALIKQHGGENMTVNVRTGLKDVPHPKHVIDTLTASPFIPDNHSLPKNEIISKYWPSALINFQDDMLVLRAIGLVLSYLQQNVQTDLFNFSNWISLEQYQVSATGQSMNLDSKALEDLQILETENSGLTQFSLLSTIDRTSTPFGKRLLREWVCHPLISALEIEERLKCVDFFLGNPASNSNGQTHHNDEMDIDKETKCSKGMIDLHDEPLGLEVKESLMKLFKKLAKFDLPRILARCASNRLSVKEFCNLIDGLSIISQSYQDEWFPILQKSNSNGSTPKMIYTCLSSFNGKFPTIHIDESESNNHIGQNKDDDLIDIDSADEEAGSAKVRPLGIKFDINPSAHLEIKWLLKSFDRQSALESGVLIPETGVDLEFDKAKLELSRVEKLLELEVKRVKSFFKSNDETSSFRSLIENITMMDSGNMQRLIEVPVDLISKLDTIAPFMIEQKKKATSKVKRYYTLPIIEECDERSGLEGITKKSRPLLHQYEEASLFLQRATSGCLSNLMERVSSCSRIWWHVWSENLAILDCLLSNSFASYIDPNIQSRPKLYEIIGDDEDCLASRIEMEGGSVGTCKESFLEFRNLIHPLVASSMDHKLIRNSSIIKIRTSQTNSIDDVLMLEEDGGQGGHFIPNDISVGKLPDDEGCYDDDQEHQAEKRTILLTGPNMGGKSTMLRQVCLAVLMAQIGIFPFSTRCRLSTFDRIFTRIGASDQIFEGKSTFMVEMEEASNVMANATRKSLVILDELGRGTSTFDGYSVAYAALKYISSNINCITLFSTHYHFLTSDVEREKEALKPRVRLCFMDAQVDPKSSSVVFLYKIRNGVCPKSYGLVVADMARLPLEIIRNARTKARQFEIQFNSNRISSPVLKQSYLSVLNLLKCIQLKMGKSP